MKKTLLLLGLLSTGCCSIRYKRGFEMAVPVVARQRREIELLKNALHEENNLVTEKQQAVEQANHELLLQSEELEALKATLKAKKAGWK